MCLEQDENRRIVAFLGDIVACFPESDRYTGLRCHAFVTIKRHISDTRKPLSLLGKIVTAVFVSDRRFGPVSSAYMQLLYQ